MDQDQNSNNNIGEDFEMRPLTAGLGFHKRSVSLKEHVANSGIAQQSMRRGLPNPPADEMLAPQKGRSSKEIIAELHRALEPNQETRAPSAASQVKLSEPLPREIGDLNRSRSNINQQRERNKNPFENINFQIPNKTISDSTGTRRGAHDSLTSSLTPVAVSFSSLALDAIIVLAVALIFLVCLVSVTGINLNSVIHSAKVEFAAQLSLIVMYFAVFEMYMIISRSFFGRTVGEWTFDLQLGDNRQIRSTYYPAMVLWRSILNLITGLVTLPIISLLMGRDFAASFTGLQLYRKTN